MMRRFAAAILYAAAFLAQYQLILVPLFGYWGFGPVSGPFEFAYLLPMMAAPALCMPDSIDRPSALLAFLNYVVLYVPLCVLLFHSTLTAVSVADQWAIFSCLAASTLLLFVLPRLPVAHWVSPAPKSLAAAVLPACWCALAVLVLLVLAMNRIHAVGFKDIDATRGLYAANIRPMGPFFVYFDFWCGLALIPLLFSDALRKGQAWRCGVLVLVCVLLFLVSGRKTILLSPIAVLGAHWALRRGLSTSVLTLIFAGLLLAPFALDAAGLKGPGLLYTNVVNFRVFAVPQVLVPQYYAYYLAHGFTHFRSINLVNRFFYGGASFEQPWSAIAHFYYKKNFIADAVFYASDGLAALGIPGLPLVTLALAFVFWTFDSLAARHPKALVLPAMMPFLFSLFNNSLFTSMLTGGGFVLMLLFFLLRGSE